MSALVEEDTDEPPSMKERCLKIIRELKKWIRFEVKYPSSSSAYDTTGSETLRRLRKKKNKDLCMAFLNGVEKNVRNEESCLMKHVNLERPLSTLESMLISAAHGEEDMVVYPSDDAMKAVQTYMNECGDWCSERCDELPLLFRCLSYVHSVVRSEIS